MFERFTEQAINVMMLAQEESRRIGHNYVGTVQILLGLIGEEKGIAAKVLKSVGVNLKDARIEVEKISGRGSGFVAVEIPFTPSSKRVLELSVEKANQLKNNNNYVDTEHLLLALITEEEGGAVRVLETLGVDLSKFRTQVLRMLNNDNSQTQNPEQEKNIYDYITQQALTVGRQVPEDLSSNSTEDLFSNFTIDLIINSIPDPRIKNLIAERQIKEDLSIEENLFSDILPLPSHLRFLPISLAQMHRLGIYPPLSLVQDLLNLTGGQPVDNPLAQLARDTRISELIALHWSAPARIGLVTLLLHKIPFSGWEPPSGISPREISNALQAGLKGEPIEPQAPPPPISLLQEAAKLINEQLLSLLTILGERAVAAEPALPLRLLSRLPNLPALSSLQRQLLGVRVCFGDQTGRSIGNAPGAERGQVSGVETSSRTDWSSLLPSQLALPQPVLNYRYQRGELLFRTRELAEPPRLRPTVLLLDITPPVFGSIEAITRIAAFAVANFLREAEIPVVLITTGDKQEQIMPLDNPQDLVEIWTQRTISPANEVRSLKLANAIRTNLKDESGLEPIILLLTHPWFGADYKISPIPGLRGLFVQYPSFQVQPTIANLCERYSYIDAKQTADLGPILGYLMG